MYHIVQHLQTFVVRNVITTSTFIWNSTWPPQETILFKEEQPIERQWKREARYLARAFALLPCKDKVPGIDLCCTILYSQDRAFA